MQNPTRMAAALALCLWLSTATSFAQSPGIDEAARSRMAAFARSHSQTLDLSSRTAFRADLLDAAGKQIIMLGETHGMPVNNDLDLALLRWLHHSAGVRVYLSEFGHATAFLINRYFETGDEHLLDVFFGAARGTQIWNREYRDFFVRFRQWNASLPAADRVRFVGVDIEHNPNFAVWALGEWVRESRDAGREVPAAIAGVAERLAAVGTRLESPEASALVSEAPDDFAAHRGEWSRLLGPRLADFEIVTANLGQRNIAYAGKQDGSFNQIRDHAMYETFLKLYPTLGGARCYGRWGSAHIAQTPLGGTRWFASYLNQPDSPVAGKILSIWPFYEKSETLAPSGDGRYRVKSLSEASSVPGLPASAGPVTLVRLGGENLPFASLPFGDRKLGEVMQYAVLIRGATAAHPMEASAMYTPPAPGSPEAAAPVVIKTLPESGRSDVPAGESDLVITFSQPMNAGSYSFVTAAEGVTPPGVGSNPRFDAEGRTCTLRVKLAPGTKYAVWINRGQFQNFLGRNGTPAVPYLLVFETRQ